MSNKSYTTNDQSIIPPHGGYRQLKSYQTTIIIYDMTVEFCKLYINPRSRTKDQMEQAARSGKQNIPEGSLASGTSKKTEIRLVNVARASLEELLQDYEDFLRQSGLQLWGKDHPKAQKVRALAYMSNKSYKTYETYLENSQDAANCLICLIHQANYLLDRQLQALGRDFLEKGGFSENLYRKRQERRKSNL